MHQNMSLVSNGMDRVCSFRKISMRLRTTNFCSSSARFAPSFVTQPNCPKCTKIVRNAPKHEFRVQWGGSSAFVAKNSDATSWHDFLHHYDRFAPRFVTQPNDPQCTKIVRNTTKHEFRVQWGGSGAFVAKTFEATCWHKFCTSSARFAPSFVTQPNGRNAPKLYEMHQNISLGSNRIYRVRSFRKISKRLRAMNFCTSSARFALSFVSQLNGPKCTQILRNAPKHEFRVQWCGMGAFVEKNSHTAPWHELLHQFGQFCTEFRKSTKTVPNAPKFYEMHQNIC